jgi:hypothetical protein
MMESVGSVYHKNRFDYQEDGAMRKKRIAIRETGTEFETGVVFIPSWDDFKAVLGRLWELGMEPEIMPYNTSIQETLRNRSIANKVVPDMLAKAEYRKLHENAPFVVQAGLWVIACYNYKWCRGPYPGTIKKYRAPKRKPVMEFRCPYCGNIWTPNPRFKNRKVILSQFASWIANHKSCNSVTHIELAPGVV